MQNSPPKKSPPLFKSNRLAKHQSRLGKTTRTKKNNPNKLLEYQQKHVKMFSFSFFFFPSYLGNGQGMYGCQEPHQCHYDTVNHSRTSSRSSSAS